MKDKKLYRDKEWYSLNSLADFIAEFNKDGKYNKTAWEFWDWFDKKCKISDKKILAGEKKSGMKKPNKDDFTVIDKIILEKQMKKIKKFTIPELKKHLRALEKKSDFIVSGKELLESLNELDKKKTK